MTRTLTQPSWQQCEIKKQREGIVESSRSSKLVMAGFAGSLVVAIATIVFLSWPSPQVGECPPKVKELADKAKRLQEAKNWSEAKVAWEEVEKEIAKSNKEACRMEAVIAGNNRALMTILRDDAKKPEVKGIDLPPKQMDPISLKDLLAFYPEGRKVKTVGHFRIKGQGSGQDWGLKGKCHFQYIHEVVAEWTVKSNDNKGTVEFELWLARVEETMGESRGTLEFAPPDPLLQIAWETLRGPVLSKQPHYRMVQFAWEAGGRDAAKHELNWVADRFRPLEGIRQANVLIAEQVSRLSGMKVKMKFVNGFGVTRIDAAFDNPGGSPITRELLMSLADNFNPLLDYKIFPGEKKVGDEWDVQASEIANLIAVGYDVALDGKVRLKRKEDKVKDKIAVLSIQQGFLAMKGKGQDADRQAKVDLNGGELHFHLEEKVAQFGEVKLRARNKFESKTHLVFKASQLQDLEMKSRYEARRVRPEGQ